MVFGLFDGVPLLRCSMTLYSINLDYSTVLMVFSMYDISLNPIFKHQDFKVKSASYSDNVDGVCRIDDVILCS